MYNPVSTYRIQFHKEFTFDDLEQIIPYLAKLGVGAIYASPIFKAVPGSNHGYDSVDPLTINPDIGTEDQLRSISRKLKEHGIGWIQDIVPNHMAYHSSNEWLMHVLEHGPKSEYAPVFDIDWQQKLMVPFLGGSLEEALGKNELCVERVNDKLVLKYYKSRFPLLPSTYSTGEDPDEISNDQIRFRKLLDAQHYRLCHWQETDKQINYRRFFTINGLICLNIHDEAVFRIFHQKVKALVDEGLFTGLRIDHIDGLSDPTKYLEDLRLLVGENVPIVVEKILAAKEPLPSYWPVEGSTGYDFLALVNNLFTNTKAKPEFARLYRKLTGDNTPIAQQIQEKKAHILFEHMGGELQNLYQLFVSLELGDKKLFAVADKDALKLAIAELLIQSPVYRYYGNRFPLPSKEEEAICGILNNIRINKPELQKGADILEQVFVRNVRTGDAEYNSKVASFYKRCMQFAGPLMAKGVEDTLMYTYNRFIGHNDVGDSPDEFGISIEEFHKAMAERQRNWPLTMNATATHDTKRGEDARARLNVLTDLPALWKEKVAEWQKLNASLKTTDWPDTNDEYFIYQVLVGMYPFDDGDTSQIKQRLDQYIEKALREAKRHSNWTTPNTAYEEEAKKFAAAQLDPQTPFLNSFNDFLESICDSAIVNSLAQVLLKFTSPGVPDTYQGTELWDLSLVDPDNRRPVDFSIRNTWLNDIANAENLDELWANRHSGKIKLWLIYRLMNLRKQYSELFLKGKYIPIEVKGKYRNHLMAFMRRYKTEWCLTVIPLHTASMLKDGEGLNGFDWKDTRLVLPENVPAEWSSMAGEKLKIEKLAIADLFAQMPVALLIAKSAEKKRSAGVLLAISSLPSDYGVGDLGPYAHKFARFLSRGHQKYWQILPLNPTDAGAGHSPYSSVSSMAGNTLLLSPDMLVAMGLLDEASVKRNHLPHRNKADYAAAERIKAELFDEAYRNYVKGQFVQLHHHCDSFCKREAYWLNDFALYVVIKQMQNNKPWYEWPEELKRRDAEALNAINKSHEEDINKVKWLQLLFTLQWSELKDYCHSLGIEVFGDMPFYVSHDSADVWANLEIFCLDENLDMAGVAGVPPDYFSEDGQLWGMPTFNWDVLGQQNYSWWIARLKKNLELFDLLRLDHFRAFAEYWEVPAGETTAKNGEWKKGPGREFFDIVRKELGSLPFVAEDLGDNMEPVYALRDELGLPGMRVLQFAFGSHMPNSVDIPHNHVRNAIVYTGTHDNNTALGWYQQDANKVDHHRFEEYNGTSIRKKDIHLVLGRMAYSSVADVAILPMQDILGLGEESRMNTPGLSSDNWLWRLSENQLTKGIEKLLRRWTEIYNR
ncbi:malto-oligosyltrehalose synthase [Polluticoccus soli]|uniref:malto-oligosyltrehalose synthase n=1 Tax=Polluticoccus soli TaxID=3034150 RepID=UPI0023E2A294|nr:malto-oligosyltrehalose synthase [Flavipsychrobacter sp. JY13-12]